MSRPKSLDKHYPFRIQVYMEESLKDLIEQRARDEHLTGTKLALKAITLYLTKDIEDESLVIAKMTELQRQVGYLEKKIDIAQKKDIQWEQFLLTLQPELPQDPATRDVKIKRASQRYLQFLTQFRDRSKALPSMLESVLGDMREREEKADGVS